MKILYILLLLTFGFGQDYSLNDLVHIRDIVIPGTDCMSSECNGIYSFNHTNIGGYLLTGNGTRVLNIDSTGNIIFDTNFDGQHVFSGKQTNDDNFILSVSHGHHGGYYTHIKKIDENGNSMWDNEISSSGAANSIITLSDGGFLIPGGTVPCGCGGSWNARVTKKNADGGTVWSNVYCTNCACSCNVGDEMAYHALEVEDGGVVVVGGDGGGEGGPGSRGFLVKYDASGNVAWSQIYDHGGIINWFTSVKRTEDGGFIMVGSSLDSVRDVFLVKTDEEGSIVWEQNYGGEGAEDGHELIVLPSDEYIVVGTTTSYGNGQQDVWVLRVDSDGQLLWDDTIGSDGNETIRQESILYAENGDISILHTSDDGIVINIYRDDILGCTDPVATNYDVTANVDDGSCTYPDNGDYSLSFENGANVEIPHSDNLNFGENIPMSVSFWMKRNSSGEMHHLGKRAGQNCKQSDVIGQKGLKS